MEKYTHFYLDDAPEENKNTEQDDQDDYDIQEGEQVSDITNSIINESDIECNNEDDNDELDFLDSSYNETDIEEDLYDKNDPEVVAFLLSKKFPNRTYDQLPNPIDSYMDVIFNPLTYQYEECKIDVYPPEPSPFDNLKPAYAYSNKQ